MRICFRFEALIPQFPAVGAVIADEHNTPTQIGYVITAKGSVALADQHCHVVDVMCRRPPPS
jgi:hypothetical protein